MRKRQRRFEGFDDKIRALRARDEHPGHLGASGGEGSKFWMQMLTELTARGVADILIGASTP